MSDQKTIEDRVSRLKDRVRAGSIPDNVAAFVLGIAAGHQRRERRQPVKNCPSRVLGRILDQAIVRKSNGDIRWVARVAVLALLYLAEGAERHEAVDLAILEAIEKVGE